MKSFREFLSEDAVKAQQAWQEWMKQNPQEFSKGGRFYERGSNVKASAASKEFMKTFMKTGKPPAGFEFKTTRVPGQDVRGSQRPPQQPRTQQRTTTPPPPPPPPQQPRTQPRTTPPSPQVPRKPGRFAGAGTAASGVYDFISRKQAGQSTAQAAGGSVASAAGWQKGAQMGAGLAARIPIQQPLVKAGLVGTGALAGGLVGSEVASRAYDVIPKGPSQKDVEVAAQRYGMRKARQGMAASNVYGARKGSAITGVGGPMQVNKQAGTITSKGRTAQLGKTQLVRDPKTGRQVVGDLAYRGGKPVYIPRPSTASRDSNATPGGAWRNLQRTLNIGGQRQRDVSAAKQEYRTALGRTQQYTRQLGISPQSAKRQNLPGYGSAPRRPSPARPAPAATRPSPRRPAPAAARPPAKPTGAHYGKY